MERPDFFTLKNGEKAKLPFTDQEYQRRLINLRTTMSKNNLDMIILTNDMVFLSTSYNGALFSIHGTLVCMGLILYSIGSKVIPAAELTLLSLTEVIGGIFWVWIPILGINEIPSTNTIIGGFFLFMSIIYYSLTIKSNRRFIALN